VAGERIGCIGHSLGGHNGRFTAAFDRRLRVIVSSCGFTRFHKDDLPSWTGPRYMPRIATLYGNSADRVPFDFTEIVGTFAPRPFLACAALRDHDFDVGGVRDALASAGRVYELYGKRAHLQGYHPDSKHDFPADARKVAYEFLDRHLRAGDRGTTLPSGRKSGQRATGNPSIGHSGVPTVARVSSSTRACVLPAFSTQLR
jgi:hypothetical protein